jgi:hypothetical protein
MRSQKNERSYFVQSGLKEIALLRKHFNVKGQGDNVRITGKVTPSSIKGFFREYFATVRPPKLTDDKILPRPEKAKLRALYIGQPDVNLLLNLVVRHCLYIDQIVIVDPFITLLHDDVLQRPEIWVEPIINRALCLCALEEWVNQELILIIPSVFYYRPERNQLIEQFPEAFYPYQTEDQRHEFEHHLIIRLLVSEPPDLRTSTIELLSSMGKDFTEDEKELLLQQASDYESKYPIRFRLSSDYYQKHFKGEETTSQVLDFTLSVPLLLAPIIAEEIGAFLVFERRLLHDLISNNQSSHNARSHTLQQLAIAFQELDLLFLHNVSLKQALSIRRKGYLRSFRVYLRDLWSAISEAEVNDNLDDNIFEFTERLRAEYETLEKEWRDIRKELKVKAITSGITVGLSAGSAIAIGNISLTMGVIAGAIPGLIKEQVAGYTGSAEKMRKIYKTPLSVFLLLQE